MAVYSQYNPATGQFEYFQGAPVQSSGDPSQWNWSNYGQADPRAYPDYWARPDGSLLARAMQSGLGWTAPRQAASPYGSGVHYAFSPYDAAQGIRDQAAYLNYLNQPYYSQPADGPGGGGDWGGDSVNGTGAARALGGAALLGPAGYAAPAARWFADTGRRASEAQDWVEGIY